MKLILKIFNASFDLGYVPANWKIAKIILLLKKNQNPDDPNSYRAISLLICIGKLLETILNKRMTHWAEKRKILADVQSGFRPNHSTQDIIFRLIENVKKNLRKINKTGLILFDFEKAFDTTPHINILYKLHKLKCPAKIGKWIKSYLNNRTFYINLDEDTSSTKNINSGIPHSGCISALLFATFINDIAIKLKTHVNLGMFADDISTWYSAKSVKKIEKKLQKATNLVDKYAKKWGFKLNEKKTNYIVFANNHNKKSYILNSNLNIKLNKTNIKKETHLTLLGITLDPGLTFAENFHKVRKKATIKLNIIKILGSKYYNINHKHLITI